MNTQIILVEFTILMIKVLCENSISVTDNIRKKIALEVLKVSPGSTVVSPFALSLPLCRLASVAKGHSKVELMSALGISWESQIDNCFYHAVPELSELMIVDLLLKNAIYVNDSLEVDPAFTKTSRTFKIRVDKVGFRLPKAASRYINRWFGQETLYRVSTLIDDDDINNFTSMVILNGLHYKVGWEHSFDSRFTTAKKFTTGNTTMWLRMFSRFDSFNYIDDVNNKVKILHIQLGTPGMHMIFFLPEAQTGLPDLISRLSDNPDLMIKMIKDSQSVITRPLRISLPRMLIKTYVDWTGFLKLMGINDVFSVNSSGLEGMLANTSKSHIHLSLAKQKVFMEMDEFGTMMHGKNPVQSDLEAREYAHFADTVEQLEFDHPFLFVVSLEELVFARGHHQILLVGTFYGPEEDD